MSHTVNPTPIQPEVADRAAVLLCDHRDRVFRRTDRMFAMLLAVEYVAGVAAALWLSPLTWIGASSSLHIHIIASVMLNAIIVTPPILLALLRPGQTITRHAIAFSQMLQSAMLIHLTGGRIETHFHVFGSLAFLAFYRDWRPLVTATVVVAVDHCVRGIWYPESVYGVISASPYRWLEHAAWVIFEDIFLLRACVQGMSEMQQIALRQAQLEEEVRQREAASKAKSEFLATMSHEIRTPINGVIGMLELVGDTQLSTQQNTYIDAAQTSARTLLTLINDVLDFSKIEAGQLELCPVEFDVEALFEDTMAIFARRAANKGLELMYHIAPEVHGRLVGDPDRLRQVLINLIGNAIKFTEKGEVAVRVDADRNDESTQTIRFTVRDTGIGIPADRRDRLFRSFSQVDSSMSRKYGGSGLGLAICKQLCGLMGGEIGVESTQGKGSTFWFTAALGKPAAASKGRTIPESLDGLRVLIVDDNDASRGMLADLARRWRFSPESADGGAAALRMIQSARRVGRTYGLALIDTRMPGMSGIELAAAIRNDPANAAMRILFCTTGDDGVDDQVLLQYSADGLITKPISPSRLFDLIIAAFMEHSPHPALPTTGVDSPTATPNMDILVKARILIAEDNPINQMVATELLRSEGHDVSVANNGQEAVESVRRGGFDIVLMDCQMPEMDGFEATARINEEAARGVFRRPTIIALTANAVSGDRERCLSAGMDDYVAKPIDRPLLMGKIAQAMAERGKSNGTTTSLECGGRDTALTGREASLAVAGAHTASQSGSAASQSGVAPGSATAPQNDEPPIIAQQLLERCMHNTGIATKVLQLFTQSCPPDMRRLDEAIASGDAAQARELAHRIKGGAGQIAAAKLHVLAAELEQLAKAGDLASARAQIAELQAEVDRCVQRVPQLTQEIGV